MLKKLRRFLYEKRTFKYIFLLLEEFVFVLTISSLFIAITGFFLPYFSFLLYGINSDFKLLFSSFLLTFAVYSLDKLSNIKEDSISLPERARFISKYKKILTFITIASYVTALFLSLSKNPSAFFVVLFPLWMGLIYSIKIVDIRLKDILAVKNIVIALSWATIGTFLPLAVSSRTLTLIAFVFYFIFMKCFINTVLFDVRDIKGDIINCVRTIPVFLGIKKTKKFLLILNSFFIPWLLLSQFQGFFHKYLLILFFNIIYGYWYIMHFCREGITIGKSLDLLVDGEWIPVVILVLLFDRTMHLI